MAKETASTVLSVEGREVQITHPDKPYFSQARISKLDLVLYYLSVAPGALAGIQDRPIVLKRFVNGAEADPFYQKRAPAQRQPGGLAALSKRDASADPFSKTVPSAPPDPAANDSTIDQAGQKALAGMLTMALRSHRETA